MFFRIKHVQVLVCFLPLMLSKGTLASSFCNTAFCSSISNHGSQDSSTYVTSDLFVVSNVDKIKTKSHFFAPRQHGRHTKLAYSARYDNLVGGLAQISLGASLCVLWSEWNVITTGCGPVNLSDFLERLCYQLDIVFAGGFWLSRLALSTDITTLLRGNKERKNSIIPWGFELESLTLLQVTWSEWLAYASVIGALIALASQILNGSLMDGLSGIDIQQCRAMRDFRNLY